MFEDCRQETKHCGCIGHTFPGVSHMVACCDVPHITDAEFQALYGDPVNDDELPEFMVKIFRDAEVELHKKLGLPDDLRVKFETEPVKLQKRSENTD